MIFAYTYIHIHTSNEAPMKITSQYIRIPIRPPGYNAAKGFGFIVCPELQKAHHGTMVWSFGEAIG